ncbi:hypothetical protein Bbelb_338520 [Branchiostoma belcheri]|nr:hypothetical protein Bbelb_338520 [Branchiostoma belcheri]
MNISGQMESEIGAVGRRERAAGTYASAGSTGTHARGLELCTAGGVGLITYQHDTESFLSVKVPPVIRMNQKMERTQECLSAPLSHAKADCSVPRHRESLSDTSKLTSAGDPI